MNLVGGHTLMVHRACARPAGVGIARVDITVINIVWRNILFCIRRNLASTLPLARVRVAVRKSVVSFVIFIMVLLFLSLRWITFSNSASCSVAKDPSFLIYVRMESRINI